MNEIIHNAFYDDEGREANKASAGTFGKGLAASLSPMQAKLVETLFGWSMQLSPIRAYDALRPWKQIAADVLENEGEEPSVLLFDVALGQSDRRSGDQADEAALSSGQLGALADQAGVGTISRFQHGSGDQLVLTAASQRDLVGAVITSRLRSVLVDGPIEQSDGRAIAQAVQAGYSPLEVEFRALAALEMNRDRVATLHVRDKGHAAMLVAENFRHYLAALRGRPAEEFDAPHVSQLQRLLEVTGTLTIRPIETDIYSTSIDVGISTDAEGRSLPADKSLIYDVPSNTWHDEP